MCSGDSARTVKSKGVTCTRKKDDDPCGQRRTGEQTVVDGEDEPGVEGRETRGEGIA